MTLVDIYPISLWFAVAGVFGSLWGSFANVVIYRWPQGRSIAWPGSHCPVCGTPIAPWENIPVLSYLLLRGRCRTCGVTISSRYPMVELSVALLSISCFRDTFLLADPLEWLSVVEYLAVFAFCWALVVIAFIDLDTQLIPTSLTTGIIATSLAAHLILPGGEPVDGAVGMVVGFVMVWVLSQGYKLVRGELGMGMGDAHLMAMVGALLGWRGALFTMAAGAVQGALAQLVMFLADRRWRQGPVPAWRRPVPFGPFLAIGALEYVVLGGWLQPLLRAIFLV